MRNGAKRSRAVPVDLTRVSEGSGRSGRLGPRRGARRLGGGLRGFLRGTRSDRLRLRRIGYGRRFGRLLGGSRRELADMRVFGMVVEFTDAAAVETDLADF